MVLNLSPAFLGWGEAGTGILGACCLVKHGWEHSCWTFQRRDLSVAKGCLPLHLSRSLQGDTETGFGVPRLLAPLSFVGLWREHLYSLAHGTMP